MTQAFSAYEAYLVIVTGSVVEFCVTNGYWYVW